MFKVIPANTIAQYVVAFFQEHGDLITHLKLQKLLYYIQGMVKKTRISKNVWFDPEHLLYA